MTMPTMQVAAPENPDVAFAERDYAIRKGGGMTEDRPLISWAEYLQLRAGRRDQLRKYAIAYYGPNAKTGERGGDRSQPLAMPAEKHAKWWAQGYKPVDYIDPGPPPPPRRWLPSMVEEAIDKGEPIPEEMRPVGYFGPTFKAGAGAIGEPADASTAAEFATELELAAAQARIRDLEAQLAAKPEPPAKPAGRAAKQAEE